MVPIFLLSSRCIGTIPIWVRVQGLGGALGQSSLAMCRSCRVGGSGRKNVWRHVRGER